MLPSRPIRPLLAVLLLGLILLPAQAAPPGESPGRKHTTIERMSLPRLHAVQEDIRRLQEQRETVPLRIELNDYKSILHAHAEDSDHTGGTRPEMLEDAKKTGVEVIMLTDHLRPPRDFMDSWRGMRDGVLFIPGSEAKGFLIYPMESVMDQLDLPTEEFVEVITEGDGLIFLSHVEARPDHPLEGLTGLEIYNRHADAMDDMPSMLWIYGAMTDPERLAHMKHALEQYPLEVFGAQQDHLQIYMDTWDRGLREGLRLTGIAANDCHHNQVLITKMVDEETVLIGTIVDSDEQMRTVSAADAPGIRELTAGHAPGDIVATLDFDPYHVSFQNCSTHIFAPELTEEAIRTALQAGHAYVSHDWLGDPKGFVYGAVHGSVPAAGSLEIIMGDETSAANNLHLVAATPLPASLRLIRNGEEVARVEDARRLVHVATEPGAYRVEAWLPIDGEERPWIISNPVYVRQ